jgi:hypothetical protein
MVTWWIAIQYNIFLFVEFSKKLLTYLKLKLLIIYLSLKLRWKIYWAAQRNRGS